MRRLSGDEVAVLMGFHGQSTLPRDMQPSLKFHVVGNSVNVDSAHAVTSAMKEQLWGSRGQLFGEEFFAQHVREQGSLQRLTGIRDSDEWKQLSDVLAGESRTADAPESTSLPDRMTGATAGIIALTLR